MPNAKVVFIHGLSPALVQAVTQCQGPGFETVSIDGKAPLMQQVEAVRDAQYLMIYRAQPAPAVFEAARQVRLVQLLSAGYDMLDVGLLRQLGLPLAQNAGANSLAVADHAVMAMLALYRRLVPVEAALRQGRWSAGLDGTNTFEMAGKQVGIVGLGHIGMKVARRVQAFDAQVIYYNRTRLSEQEEQRLQVRWVDLDTLFASADIVSLHTPLSPSSRHLVNRQRLALMKRHAILINTARGEIIDQAALIESLQAGQIGGAGLDVFDPEPLPADSPLLQMDNVLLSPHSAGTTWDTWRRRGEFAYENFERVQQGGTAQGLV